MAHADLLADALPASKPINTNKTQLAKQVEQVFTADGALAQTIQGFKTRPQQLEMAQAVRHAIETQDAVIVEAGTGTGKTFAYLVPALLSGGKVIISTGTKTLQDQLFSRDIQTVRTTLNVPITVALLKGRSNYICHYHLEVTQAEGQFRNREDAAYLPLISAYAKNSKTGDKGNLGSVPENATIWAQVTSTRDSCLGQDCPHYKECFVMQARKEAMQADVVVVNHHLFFADVWLRDEGAGELLPACNTVIFDEAHQLPEIASLFFGENLSSSQLLELVRDARIEALLNAKDTPKIMDSINALDKAVRDVRLCFKQENQRQAKHQLPALFNDALLILQKHLTQLYQDLQALAERAEGLKNCANRAREHLVLLNNWMDADAFLAQDPIAPTDENAAEEAAPQKNKDSYVHWVEVFNQAFQLNSTPLDIAKVFRKQMGGQPKAWVFTSATLSMNGNFKHYAYQLGLGQAAQHSWDSPFDYKKQALLYAPQNMPDPNSQGYTEAVMDAAMPAIKASQGRAFLLFTSLKAMREAHGLLKTALGKAALDYPILLQGEGSRSELLERFRSLPNAILVASQTFWEGIDVKGDALSLVVIDKLPFAPPDDPVLAARVEQMKNAGRNAFMEYQLPHSVITLKQGAGRLIRDETDTGVLMICDPRLTSKPYGAIIWKSLPRMLRTSDVDVVRRFYAYWNNAVTV